MRRMRRRILHRRCVSKLRFLNMFITVFLVIKIHLYLQNCCVVLMNLIWSETFLLVIFSSCRFPFLCDKFTTITFQTKFISKRNRISLRKMQTKEQPDNQYSFSLLQYNIRPKLSDSPNTFTLVPLICNLRD
jgi:hypothetical protein